MPKAQPPEQDCRSGFHMKQPETWAGSHKASTAERTQIGNWTGCSPVPLARVPLACHRSFCFDLRWAMERLVESSLANFEAGGDLA